MMRLLPSLVFVTCAPIVSLAVVATVPPSRVLFDFEEQSELSAWSNLELGDPAMKEPDAKWELSTEHVSSGRHSLKITFAGGRWPTLTTAQVPPDWMAYETFLADVVVSRPCLIGFTVLQEGSKRGSEYNAAMGRWTKTAFLRPGKNLIVAPLRPRGYGAIRPKYGNTELGTVVRLEIFLYNPHHDEAIWIDNIRLSPDKAPAPEPEEVAFKVLGTDLVVGDVRELGKKLSEQWVKPRSHSLAEVEGDFTAQYEALKKQHPGALLAIFRDGEPGFDPVHPDKVYSGWSDSYWSSHGPDGAFAHRATNIGHLAKHEVFMRHRAPLMRVDLSTIPPQSKILAARLLIVRADAPGPGQGPYRPNMWVAEACNRPWKEHEVNAFQYAKDMLWKEVGGAYYGADPDFLPLYLAHGPSQDGVSTWDFTQAVRHWTNGKNANHGFMLHGDAGDKLIAWSRETEELEKRPALLVIYEPPPAGKAFDAKTLDNAASRWAADGPGGRPDFTRHVMPLLSTAGCNSRSCHGSFHGQNGFRLSLFGHDAKLDHDELTRDEGHGSRVHASEPETSLLLRKPLGELDHGGGEVLQRGSWQYNLLRAWVTAGAEYNSSRAPKLMKLTLTPAEVPLRLLSQPKAHLRLVATFDDGSLEDVTPLSLFSCNDESVARVDPAGHITAAGRGDTAIVATYAGSLVTSQVIVPQEDRGPFPEYSPASRIDELVVAKLRKLGIHPSDLASDDEFLRRVHLDLIGTLPTSDEARRFLDNKRANKRQQLVDDLLDRPEYALYWATKFSDWTGNSNDRSTSAKLAWQWHGWLRDKLARNAPYDQIVGGFLTATSREGRTGEELIAERDKIAEKLAAGFDDSIYASRQTNDLYWLKRGNTAETLAVQSAYAFLAIRLECAQCHRHPFDQWTQEDFQGYTAFFDVVSRGVQDDIKAGLVARGVKLGLFGFNEIYIPDKRKSKVQPKLLGGAEVSYEAGPDPRHALWQWLRSAENPLLAQAIVNRIWGHYFGVGIVSPVDDFNAANPPSNPQLLQWLREDLVGHGFDLKRLHRVILNSRTYQSTWVPNDTNRLDERNYSHALLRRMPAEVLLDAINQVTGGVNSYNPNDAPPGTRAIGLAPSQLADEGPAYGLSIFGRPNRTQNCDCQRDDETSLSQALYLINDQELHGKIVSEQGRLARLLATTLNDAALVEELYLSALSRYPRPDEVETALDFIAASAGRKPAMEALLWSLINLREFVLIR